MAAVTSPRITDGEILGLANSRTVNADVLRYIYTNREFLRTYAIKISLVKNPKVPLPTALKMLHTLQEKDIKELARIASGNRRTRDYTLNNLSDALEEVVACFPVYRTYVTDRGASDTDALRAFHDGSRRYAPMNYLLAYLTDDYLREMAE